MGEIVRGLHFHQSRGGALERRDQALAGVQRHRRGVGGADQVDVAVVQFVDQVDETAGRIVAAAIQARDAAKQYGVEHLAGPQGHVLSYLGKNQDQEIFVKDIEEELCISKSVTSNLVKRMVKNGFIQILPSRTDKRYKQVVLTELGQKKLDPLLSWHQEMVDSLFKGVPQEDFKAMMRITHQLKENIKQYKEKNHV